MQGVCSAALVPLSQAILFDIYPVERRGFAMAVWGMGVMIGPILGPTLGGYLTEIYNWRYVFYINLPFGVLATLGLMLFMHEPEGESHLRFDWLGFFVLSTGIGALQMMLDRGNNQDWFTSREIIDRGGAGRSGHLPVPGAHGLGAASADPPDAVPRREFLRRPGADVRRRHSAGLIDRADGAVAADAGQLSGGDRRPADGAARHRQPVHHRPVRPAGDALSIRAGSAAIGLLMQCWSFWVMTGWTPDVSAHELVITIAVQGAGLGLVFTPLQVLAFATLAPSLRTEGAALFSLGRNIGAAIGVSVTTSLLAHNAQALHEVIGASVNPFNRALQALGYARELARSGQPPRRDDARPDRQPPGADHRLYQRLRADDLHHDAGAAAVVADAPPAPRPGGRGGQASE